MAYTTKAQLSLATNTATIPGDWVDMFPAFEIAGNALVRKSGVASGYQLYNGYSETNKAASGEGDQKVKFRFVASANQLSFRFRYSVPGGVYSQFILVYIGLANAVRVDYRIGAAATVSQSTALALTYGVSYDCECWVEGAGASTVLTCNIYTTAGALAFSFILGTGGVAWTNTALLPSTGRFEWLSNPASILGYGGVNYIEYLTQGATSAATATVTEKNADQTSGGVTLAIAGGVPPYSVVGRINGVDLAGSPFTLASAGNLTLSKTGLSPGVVNTASWTVTPTSGAAVSSTANFFTEPFDLASLRTNGLRSTQVGDSITNDEGNITIGGGTWTGQSVGTASLAVAAAAIGGVLGTALATSSNRVATGGYTTEQIAAVTPQIVAVINGGYTGPNTSGSAHPAGKPAMIVPIRLFKNDTEATPAESIANLQIIIAGIRAGCPHNPWILLGRVTGSQGTGSYGTAITADRQYQINQLLEDLHDPDNRIVVESMVAYWPGVLVPANISDGTHPDAAYRGILVMSYAHTIIEAVLGLSSTGGGSSSGSGGGNPGIGIGF